MALKDAWSIGEGFIYTNIVFTLKLNYACWNKRQCTGGEDWCCEGYC